MNKPAHNFHTDYFGQFCRFAACNLVACIGYFLLAAILSLTGAPEDPAGALSTAVVTLFFGASVFLVCRFSRTERDAVRAVGRPLGGAALLRAYFAGEDESLPCYRTEIVCFVVWSIFGAMIAFTGEAVSLALYLFLAQAMPCTLFILWFGTIPGVIAGTLFNLALFTLLRVLALLGLGRTRKL